MNPKDTRLYAEYNKRFLHKSAFLFFLFVWLSQEMAQIVVINGSGRWTLRERKCFRLKDHYQRHFKNSVKINIL